LVVLCTPLQMLTSLLGIWLQKLVQYLISKGGFGGSGWGWTPTLPPLHLTTKGRGPWHWRARYKGHRYKGGGGFTYSHDTYFPANL
jgi:hypothetical protein